MKQLFKKYRAALVILVLIVVGVLYLILSRDVAPDTSLSPFKKVEDEVESTLVFQGKSITINETVAHELGVPQAVFGDVLYTLHSSSEEIENAYDWKSEFVPLLVTTTEKGVIRLMKVPELPAHKGLRNFSLYRELGNPDFDYFLPEYHLRLAVYLDEGKAIQYYDVNTPLVTYVWHFEPMSKTEFLRTWGEELMEEFDPSFHEH